MNLNQIQYAKWYFNTLILYISTLDTHVCIITLRWKYRMSSKKLSIWCERMCWLKVWFFILWNFPFNQKYINLHQNLILPLLILSPPVKIQRMWINENWYLKIAWNNCVSELIGFHTAVRQNLMTQSLA